MEQINDAAPEPVTYSLTTTIFQIEIPEYRIPLVCKIIEDIAAEFKERRRLETHEQDAP